jgi:tripartite-type tricarboxylate transporter receptor subunit TctC
MMARLIIHTCLRFALFACATTCYAAAPAKRGEAQYPNKSVRLIVPYAAGGPTDTLSRLVGKRLSEKWGQQVVIDNRGGANGLIAAERAARAAPDGYTLFLGNAGVLGSNPALYAKLPYDAIRDYAPVTILASAPLMLIAHPSLKATTVLQLIDVARTRQGQLTFASGGTGGVAHLAGELLNSMTGIKTTHIAYKGAAPAMTDLIAGQVSFNFTSTVTALPQVKAGKLIGIGVTTAKRAPSLPDVPAIGESVPGYEVSPWYGIVAPAGTPRRLIELLSRDMTEAVRDREVESRVVSDGGLALGGTPDEFARIIREDIAKWTRLAKSANLKLE